MATYRRFTRTSSSGGTYKKTTRKTGKARALSNPGASKRSARATAAISKPKGNSKRMKKTSWKKTG